MVPRDPISEAAGGAAAIVRHEGRLRGQNWSKNDISAASYLFFAIPVLLGQRAKPRVGPHHLGVDHCHQGNCLNYVCSTSPSSTQWRVTCAELVELL